MFPRVLGQWIGRMTAATCEGFRDIGRAAHSFVDRSLNGDYNETYRNAAINVALLSVPSAARPLVSAYRAWSHFQNRSNQVPAPSRQNNISKAPLVSRAASSLEQGLACYADAMASSDPILLSPFGTNPFERCFR